MSSSDRKPLLALDYADKVCHVLKIIKWLADAHDNDVADMLALLCLVQMKLNLHNLLHDFSAR
ncbi:hypothetical protein D3C72_2412640 [compost metagenome]